MVDRTTGLSRQIGFVRYENTEHARAAIEEMNNYKLFATAQPLTVKYADTKEQKQVRKSLRQKQTTPPLNHDQHSPSLHPPYYYYQHPPPYGFPYPYPIPQPYPVADLYHPSPSLYSPSPSLYSPASPYPTYDYPPMPPTWVNYAENGIYENDHILPTPETSSSVLSLPFYPEMVPYYPPYDYHNPEVTSSSIDQEDHYDSQPLIDEHDDHVPVPIPEVN